MVLAVCSVSSSSSLLTDDVTALPSAQKSASVFFHPPETWIIPRLPTHPPSPPTLFSSPPVVCGHPSVCCFVSSCSPSSLTLFLHPLSAAESPEFLTDVVGFQSYKNSHTQSRSNTLTWLSSCVIPRWLPLSCQSGAY